MDLCSITQLRALLARHGFHFSRSMGQNFLVASWVPRQIAGCSGAGPGTGVLEIGPGIGALTEQLCALADRVVSVELDRSLLPILEETLAGRDNVEIVPGDILKTDIPALVRQKFPGLTPLACANLPYNITSPALTALLEAGCFASITVMVQKEVARRICAGPGEGDYGAFSVLCQYHAAPRILFDVPPSCFLPAPKVTSSVVQLLPRPAPEQVDDEDHFFRVVRAAFAMRRKTLLNALVGAFGSEMTKQDLLSCILRCNLPADIRGERLSIPDFARLSRAIRGLDK